MTRPEGSSSWENGTPGTADMARIRSLVAELANQDGISPTKARESLVAIGKPAVPYLVEALGADDDWMRWEVAKTLSQIADPSSAAVMADSLEDRTFGVRWLAAMALINMGREGLPALLQALIERADSPWLRDGAHHVLHDLCQGRLRKVLRPVLQSMEGPDPSVEVPVAARGALQALKDLA